MSQYTEMRDGAPGEAGAAWREADKEGERYREFIQNLADDNRYTEVHKGETAWPRYVEAKEKVEAGHKKARELLKKQAKSSRRFSIPIPEGSTREASDATEVVAAQNEASRIIRTIERRKDAPGPFKPDPAKILSSEYGRGLEVGGVEGGAICRGVLSAAEELGVNVDAIVDPHRNDYHRESLQRAEDSARLSQSIGGRLPEPPFPKPADAHPQSLEGVLAGSSGRHFAPSPPVREKAARRWK